MALEGATSAEREERPVETLHVLRADARPLPRHNLPARQASFIGRAREVAELATLLTAPTCRLLTLSGPGGIGKTSLALEVAEATQQTFTDGVAFVPLQAVGRSDSIVPALAGALGC